MINNLLFLFFLINQGEFSISPLYFEISAPAGSRKKVVISVINETYTERVKLLLKRADIIEKEDGTYKPVEIGKGVPSCANWLKFKDSIIELAPQSGKEIEVFIEIPSGVKGGRYGAITFETQPSPEERKYRTKVPVFFEIKIKPETKPKINITDIKIYENPEKLPRFMFMGKFKDAIAILVTTKNEGDIHAVVKGSLILRDKKTGRKIKEFPLGGGRGIILPNTTVDLASVIKRPSPGEYIVDVVLHYGTLTPAKASANFTITAKKIEKEKFSTSEVILLSIKPEFIELPILPNAFRIRTLMLENQETTEVKINAEIKEILNDEKGDLFSSDTIGYPYSATTWIEMEESEFILKPNEKKVLKLKIKVPSEEGSGGRYASLVINAFKKSKDTLLPTSFHIPIFLNYFEKQREEINLEKIELTGKAPANFYLYLENTGDVNLKPSGVIILYQKVKVGGSEQTIPIGEYPLKEFKGYLLPQRKIKMFAEGPLRLKSGKYLLKIVINYGKGKEIIWEKEMVI